MIPGILLEEHISSSKVSLFEGNVALALSNARSVQSVLSNGKRLKIHIVGNRKQQSAESHKT